MDSKPATDVENTRPCFSVVRVWDVPTRLFHWIVVVLIAISWFSADYEYLSVHFWSGTILLTMLVFRIVWGIIGSSTARFSNFVVHPRRAVEYLARQTGSKPLYAGHNPAGGWMVIALIGALFCQALLGLFANNDAQFSGPLADLTSKDLSDRLSELHGAGFNVLLLLIWLHVAAVFYYWAVKGENLVTPMFTGMKPVAQVPARAELEFVRPVAALLSFVAAAALVGLLIVWGSSDA